jgi:hypothetical protein
MTESERSEIKAWSGQRYFTIDEIASMAAVGLGRIMPEVGQRYWKAYYAAKAGNWNLANYEIKELAELLEFGAITRPKYEKQLEEFVERDIGAMLRAIKNKDFAAFDAAYKEGIKNANDYHKVFEKPIVWKLPDTPPPDLDVNPQ